VKLARHIFFLYVEYLFLCVVCELYFVCICVINFEVLLILTIVATALVFDLVYFNDVTIWKCFWQMLGISVTFCSFSR